MKLINLYYPIFSCALYTRAGDRSKSLCPWRCAVGRTWFTTRSWLSRGSCATDILNDNLTKCFGWFALELERMCCSCSRYSSCRAYSSWRLCANVHFTSKRYCIASLATCCTVHGFYTTHLPTNQAPTKQKLWPSGFDGSRIWTNRKWYANECRSY